MSAALEQTAGEAEKGDGSAFEDDADDTQADAKKNNADIFDAVIGKEPLYVVLADGEQHA